MAGRFVDWLVAHGPPAARTLSLVDVGCRGGPTELVRRWPGALVGVGVDPDPPEIARLTREGRWPGMRWVAGWIGDPEFEAQLPPGMDRATWRTLNNATWRRTSSERAQRVEALPAHPGDPWHQAAPPPWSTLDALAASMETVDLLKVDTDGHDLEVLRSGPETLARCLAVAVEVQLQGPPHPSASRFATVDEHLRARGFELFDLQVHRHSRAALPAPFWGAGGSPTHRGQTVWGDALYLRDPIGRPGPPLGARAWTLAALFDLTGLADCAAELAEAGLLPGAPDDVLSRIGGSWWRDGGAWARRALARVPDHLRWVGEASPRERLRRLPLRARWRPLG